MKLITYQETLKKDSIIYIDVRTPQEFSESSIPGAINIPIFTNEERVKIGTVYNHESPAKAKMLGVEIVSPKIPNITKRIKSLADNYKNIIIFCAKGGMRSESITQFSRLAGIKVYKLEGGYKAYRNFILTQLQNYNLGSKLLVIHGFTGIGKTELLKRLKNKGVPTIDLEGLANHRGSAFGSIGLGKPTNQKQFDSLLWERLQKLKNKELIAVEAESKRIGISVLPDFFLKSMDNGIHILIKSSLKQRIDRIFNEYSDSYKQDKNAFIERTLESITAVKKHIIKKIGKKGYNNLVTLCKNGNLKEVIKILLTEYYDPLYKYSQDQFDEFALIIEEDNLKQITKEVCDFIN